MKKVYMLLGTNMGQRAENLQFAKEQITLNCGPILQVSPVYETAAWGLTSQNNFLNQAIEVSTLLSPLQLLATTKAIEQKTGRTATTRWGPRIMDIDILLYGNEIVDEPDLKIPHPYLHERRFALTPLADIANGVEHPVLHKTILQLLKECSDTSAVQAIQG